MRDLTLVAVGVFFGMWVQNYRHFMAHQRADAFEAQLLIDANQLVTETTNYLKEHSSDC